MFKKSAFIGVTICVGGIALYAAAQGQLAIVRLTLGPDQIATIKTAQGITTRVSFPEAVKEIICGDLYDAGTGKGGFVVQRSENDVFLKPIPSKAMTNLFVKTGERGEHIYNFDLIVGSMADAHRVVNVSIPPPGSQPRRGQQPADQADDILARASQKAAEIEKTATNKAARIIADAEQKAADLDRQAAETEQLAQKKADDRERHFVLAIMDGSREIKVSHPRVVAKTVIITLDHKVVVFGRKSYLRYTIQNSGTEDFEFSAISIEAGLDKDAKPIEASVIQNKSENKIAPKETIRGVIVFSADVLNDNTRLTMYLRGQDNTAIARASIQ